MVHLPGVGAPLPSAARGTGRVGSRSNSRFADHLRGSDDPNGAAEAAEAAPLSGPHAVLLALQDQSQPTEGPAERDARARRDAEEVLNDLAELQHGLLSGRIGLAGLEALSVRLSRLSDAADPGLAALVGQVALRARIELARLDARDAPREP